MSRTGHPQLPDVGTTTTVGTTVNRRGTNQYARRSKAKTADPAPELTAASVRLRQMARQLMPTGMSYSERTDQDVAMACYLGLQQTIDNGDQTTVEQALNGGLAQHPAIMMLLAHHERPWVRCSVAQFATLSPVLQQVLLRDGELRVRQHLAANTTAPTKLLQELSGDWDGTVRTGVAGNPVCPLPVLQKLLRDKDPLIASEAAGNPSLPRATRAMWQLAHS